MMWVVGGLLVIVVVVQLALVVVVARRPPAPDGALLQQQLVELRGRLDALVSEQQKVPLALAQGDSEQQRVLTDVRERLAGLTESTRRLEDVGRSVAEVQQLLKVPRLRGTLGETWLDGLLRQVFPGGSHYEMQYSFSSGETVDAVLKVGKLLVPIDSKFPLEAWQRAMRAEGEEAERERKRFLRSFRDRVDEIADKYIRPEEGTFDFALMYVPAENVYYEAMVRGHGAGDGTGSGSSSPSPSGDDSLVQYALDRRVIPVSPHTFYAYLAVILHGLRGLRVEEQARELRASIASLQQQFGQFQRSFELVGKHLTNASRQFRESERQIDRLHLRLENVTGVGPGDQAEAVLPFAGHDPPGGGGDAPGWSEASTKEE